MSLTAASALSQDVDSEAAAREVLKALRTQLGDTPARAVLLYLTVEHDFATVLRVFASELGAQVPIVGCSVGGAVSNDTVIQESWTLAAMAFAGADLQVAAVSSSRIDADPHRAGTEMGASLRSALGGALPKLVVLLYDSVCGADGNELLRGLATHAGNHVVGGGAGQPWGCAVHTWQFHGQEVLDRSAVALALQGDFDVHVEVSNSTVPLGGETLVVTHSEGNRVYTIGGRPALSVVEQLSGLPRGGKPHRDLLSQWAFRVESAEPTSAADERRVPLVRGAWGFDESTGAVVFPCEIPQGSRISLQLRTVDRLFSGMKNMTDTIAPKLAGRTRRAVLSFECAARTLPFLGIAGTVQEHRDARAAVGPETPWLGMMAWGEVAPVAGRPEYHNYIYALTVLTTRHTNN